MARNTRPAIAALICLLPLSLAAEAPEYLLRSAPLCDTGEVMCLRGSVRYVPDSRIIEVQGRVWRAPERS